MADERHRGHDQPIGLRDRFVVQAADERAAADQVPRPRRGILRTFRIARPETDRVSGGAQSDRQTEAQVARPTQNRHRLAHDMTRTSVRTRLHEFLLVGTATSPRLPY